GFRGSGGRGAGRLGEGPVWVARRYGYSLRAGIGVRRRSKIDLIEGLAGVPAARLGPDAHPVAFRIVDGDLVPRVPEYALGGGDGCLQRSLAEPGRRGIDAARACGESALAPLLGVTAGGRLHAGIAEQVHCLKARRANAVGVVGLVDVRVLTPRKPVGVPADRQSQCVERLLEPAVRIVRKACGHAGGISYVRHLSGVPIVVDFPGERLLAYERSVRSAPGFDGGSALRENAVVHPSPDDYPPIANSRLPENDAFSCTTPPRIDEDAREILIGSD